MNFDDLGRCYELGYKFQQENPEYILVHGYLTNSLPPYQTIDHCWCMKDDIVYDPVFRKKYIWNEYQKLFNAEIEKEYTITEALEMLAKTHKYGGWHEIKKFDSDKLYNEDGSLKEEYRNYEELYEVYVKERQKLGKEYMSFNEYKSYYNELLEYAVKNSR